MRNLRPQGPFAGRDREMATAQTWLEEAGGGEPRIVLVRGDAGIGKSSLLGPPAGPGPRRRLADAVRLLPPGGADPLSSARQRPRLPFGPASQLAGPPRPRSLSCSPAAADDQPESDSSADRRHLNLVVTAARAVLDAADERPLVLAIEDLHWADDSTLGFLELLAAVATQQSALTPVPLAVILTSRPTHESDAARRMTQRIRRETTCRELELTGLDSLEINEVVRELADATPSRRLLHSITEASRGNPLLVRSLVERLLSNGAIAVRGDRLGGDAPFPAVALDLDGELADRLGRVSADAEISSTGRPFSVMATRRRRCRP